MVFISGLRRPVFDPFIQKGLPTANVLQALQPPEPVAVTRAATAMDQRPNFEVPNMPLPEIKPQRERRSFLDTVGRISDVLATVGGAEALYQPTLDAREDRARMIDVEAMKRQQMEQQLAMGGEEAALLQRQKVGVAVKGLQAIAARGGDVNAAWPILAQQAGIKPEDAAVLGDAISKDPNALPAIAAMFGQEQEFGLQPFYAQDAQGNLQAYQIGKDGSLQPISLPNGSQPVDPLKFVDVGNQQVGVGSRTGRPVRIIPKGVDPNTGARIRSSERIAGANIASRENIAASRGSITKPDDAANVNAILSDFGINLNSKSDPVADMIKGSTSGRLENIGSMVPGVIGISTPGKVNIAKLETIDNAIVLALAGGKLGAGVSNADRDFFKAMSGRISDPNIPAAERLAAWNQIKQRLRGIQQRIATPQPARKTPPKRIVPRSSGKPTVSNW
jgi:hypothetical protein